jgi:putative ABC transport system permease protein
VLLFSTAASLATGLLFGLAPALRTSRAGDLVAALKQREQRFGSAAGRRWLGAIVVVEMATAVVLLVNGALIVQSFMRLQRVELGFDPSRLVTLEFTPVPARVTGHDDRVRYVDDIVARVRVLPGVVAAGITSNYPLQMFSSDSTFTVEGRPRANPADVPITAHRLVTADYLQTLGVRLLRGRLLDGHDRAGSLPVVVVSEELARQAWPGADPIGKRVRRGRLDDASNPWMTVVGVVADVKEDGFNFRINRPAWYLPYAQVSSASVTHNIVVRAAPGVDPTAVAHDVVAAVRSVEPQQAVSDVSTMTAHVADLLVTERFSATLMTTFAAVGLFLAAFGLAGVIAYSVSQRTGEIGLRMALGATGRDVLVMILREGAVLIAIGIAIGGAAARTLALALGGMLYGVHPGDPRTFLIVSAVLIVVSLAACGVPALRAMRVEPLVALKSE